MKDQGDLVFHKKIFQNEFKSIPYGVTSQIYFYGNFGGKISL